MTILQPNKYRDIKKLCVVLGSILISVTLMGVFLYSHTVSLKHDLAKFKKDFEESEVANADLKNKYYDLVDADNLEKLAEENGLIQDENPQWAFALRF
jgi:cell division protein FtsL